MPRSGSSSRSSAATGTISTNCSTITGARRRLWRPRLPTPPTGDVDRLRIAAHTLKSNARDFGALGLSSLCEALEIAARAPWPTLADRQRRSSPKRPSPAERSTRSTLNSSDRARLMPDDAPPLHEQTASVLVVDDSRVSAAKLAMAMRALGHRTEIAGNGREALRLIEERSFDVILLDIVMPEMDGYEVLRALKADPALRNVPVIVTLVARRRDRQRGEGDRTRGRGRPAEELRAGDPECAPRRLASPQALPRPRAWLSARRAPAHRRGRDHQGRSLPSVAARHRRCCGPETRSGASRAWCRRGSKCPLLARNGRPAPPSFESAKGSNSPFLSASAPPEVVRRAAIRVVRCRRPTCLPPSSGSRSFASGDGLVVVAAMAGPQPLEKRGGPGCLAPDRRRSAPERRRTGWICSVPAHPLPEWFAALRRP